MSIRGYSVSMCVKRERELVTATLEQVSVSNEVIRAYMKVD